MENKNAFIDMIKELSKKAFILFKNIKTEIAIYKEKAVDIGSPKNVLHVLEAGNFHADYVTAIKDNIGIEKLYKTSRISKGTYQIDPCLAGIFFHFCERIGIKKEMISKRIKDVKKRDALIMKDIACDLKNFNKFLCADLKSMIAKDFPTIKATRKNALSNFLIVKDVEKGIVSYHTSAKA